MSADSRHESRDNGDLVLFWPNGDPAVKFQADGPFFTMAPPGAHVLDAVAMQLARDKLEALADWTGERLAELDRRDERRRKARRP